MKKQFFFQLKSLLMLFLFSLFGASAWAITPDYVCFENTSTTNDALIKFSFNSESPLEYSTDQNTFTTLTQAGVSITKNNGKVYFRTVKTSGTGSLNTNIFSFSEGSEKIKVSGNILYLITRDPASCSTLPNTEQFRSLFSNCKAITDASGLKLSATTLSANCYQELFYHCENLTSAPTISATTLAENCCRSMFEGCESLTTAPALNATSLAKGCYLRMFFGCKALTNAPALSAEVLQPSCYNKMFEECTQLATAPALPALELQVQCYYEMFKGCTNLTTAPVLPASTLVNYCYYEMFKGCRNLKKIVVGFDTWPTDYGTEQWVSDVAENGTLVCPPNLTTNERGGSTIPDSWTIENAAVCFEATADNSSIKIEANNQSDAKPALEYWKVAASGTGSSTAWADFFIYDGTEANTVAPVVTMTNGDKVYIRAKSTNKAIGGANGHPHRFKMEGSIKASGNIMYLLGKVAPTDFTDDNAGAFNNTFSGCSALKDVSNLELPAMTMKNSCYFCMFSNTDITSAPALPSENLAPLCYNCMFQGSKITSAPALPATTMKDYCYSSMFSQCYYLTEAPALPATELADGCYSWMFANCTDASFTTAPLLPATTLKKNCYRQMFCYATQINKVTAAFSAWDTTNSGEDEATYAWLNGVAANGTFTTLSSSLPLTKNEAGAENVNRIPNSWNAETINWTLIHGAATYDGTNLKIAVTPSAKLGETAWATAVGASTTVQLWNATLDQIGTGTLSGTAADGYFVTVSDAATINALKALLGQNIQIKYQAGAFKASETAGTAPFVDSPVKVVDYTLPAAVTFTLNPTDLYIDQEQALEGFGLFVQTTGGVKPTVVAGKKISLDAGSNTFLVVELVGEPTKVSGTNKWKYTAKVKRNAEGKIMRWDGTTEVATTGIAVPPTQQNNPYPLNIEAGAFSAGLSSSTALTGSVDVKAKAEITISSYGVIKDAAVDPATEPTYTFIVNVKASTGTISAAENLVQGWTISDYTGTIAVEALAPADPIYGNYKVTLQYDKFVNNKTSWILTVPEGKFRSNNNVNKLTKINFTIEDRAKWTAAHQTAEDGDYVIEIDEVDGVATIVPTEQPSQVLSILDDSKIELVYYTGTTKNVVPATYSLAQANEELKIATDFSVSNTPYYVIFKTGAVKAGNTVYEASETDGDIVARIDVVAGYTFVDASVEGATATTKEDIEAGKTYNSLTYTRNYTGKLETLFVPFDIKPDAENAILDDVQIWKLDNITMENDQPVFNFTSVANGDIVYANMPYLIKANAAGVYDMKQKNVTTEEPTSNSIESSTTRATYTFTGVVEPTPAAGKWVVTKRGTLAFAPLDYQYNLNAWRWYMTTTDKNINYAPIRLDGESYGDETSLETIEANEQDDVIYNLSGQRQSKAEQGRVNIVNGKKVFVK